MGKKRARQRRQDTKVEKNNLREKSTNKNNNVDGNATQETFCCPPGLMNLGNTCFFNSIVQNLMNTKLLESALKKQDQKITIPPQEGSKVPPLEFILGPVGSLTKSWIQFLDEVSTIRDKVLGKRQTRNISVSPRSLFTQLCNGNPRFKGYDQHDSQELYHCFLNSLKDEEIKRRKQGILKSLNLEKAKAKDVSDEVREQIRFYGNFVSNLPTFVDKVFEGKLKSSVLCDQCGTVTEVEESFHDISLPIVEENHRPLHNNADNNADNNACDNGHNNGDNNTCDNGHTVVGNNDQNKGDNNEVQLIKKTPSKHLTKKSKKQRKRKNKIRKKKLNFEDKYFNEKLDQFASSVAELIISESFTELLTNFKIQVKGGCEISDNIQEKNLPETLIENNLETSEICPLKKFENLRLSDSSVSEQTTNKDSSDEQILQKKSKSRETLFDTPLCPRVEKSFTEFCRQLPQPFHERNLSQNQECSIPSCFYQFTKAEMLTGSNKFGCENCTKLQNNKDNKLVYCTASKQMLISKPPSIFTIHLKRFQQNRSSLRKINKYVKIPLIIDISSFCTSNCEIYADNGGCISYELYGVVEHIGTLHRGHYTAYVKTKQETKQLTNLFDDINTPPPEAGPSKWFHISDTNVMVTSQAKALNCNAYMLFYERIRT